MVIRHPARYRDELHGQSYGERRDLCGNATRACSPTRLKSVTSRPVNPATSTLVDHQHRCPQAVVRPRISAGAHLGTGSDQARASVKRVVLYESRGPTLHTLRARSRAWSSGSGRIPARETGERNRLAGGRRGGPPGCGPDPDQLSTEGTGIRTAVPLTTAPPAAGMSTVSRPGRPTYRPWRMRTLDGGSTRPRMRR